MVFAKPPKDEEAPPLRGQLPVPAAAMFAPDAQEILRFWVANQGAHVSIHAATPDNLPKGDEGIFWGIILADIARHASNALRQSGVSRLDEDRLMTQMTKTFLDELGFARDVKGQIIDGKN